MRSNLNFSDVIVSRIWSDGHFYHLSYYVLYDEIAVCLSDKEDIPLLSLPILIVHHHVKQSFMVPNRYLDNEYFGWKLLSWKWWLENQSIGIFRTPILYSHLDHTSMFTDTPQTYGRLISLQPLIFDLCRSVAVELRLYYRNCSSFRLLHYILTAICPVSAWQNCARTARTTFILRYRCTSELRFLGCLRS